MGPVTLPKGQGLNQYTLIHENLYGPIGHFSFRFKKLPLLATQENGNIRIALAMMSTARSACEKQGFSEWVFLDDLGLKSQNSFLCLRIDEREIHSTIVQRMTA